MSLCGFAEVIRLLDVRDAEVNRQDLVEPHCSHDDLVSVGKQLAGAQPPLPETFPEEWVEGEPDSPLHDGHQPERHPAVAVCETVVGSVWSNLYSRRDFVFLPKQAYGQCVP
eukprot:TRINITY_DN13610_c0_g3_i1.p3 TRINITY_DN13610_c0_g3~~TRINITY_DN13610_c0_g3_i1.p3  ORF type:complete len:112 (+),score=7.08 TRINITY_DN13610_c0_g3_i1:106-441(+)